MLLIIIMMMMMIMLLYVCVFGVREDTWSSIQPRVGRGGETVFDGHCSPPQLEESVGCPHFIVEGGVVTKEGKK